MTKILMKKSVFFLGIMFILFLQMSTASTIGISPSRITFNNVLRGGFAERVVVISIDADSYAELTVKPRGEIENWLNFSDKSFRVSRDDPYELVISVNPPSDMPNGIYRGILRVESSGTGQAKTDYATGIIKTAVDLAIEVEVTDIESMNCRASLFNVNSIEKGDDIVFSMEVLNQGNIRLRPNVKINIWDQEQSRVVMTRDFTNQEILPTKKDKILMKVPSSGLEIGQYWAEIISIDCLSSEILTFDVLEIGALKADGKLVQILAKTWVDAGETIPISVIFENTGEKNLEAIFRGNIMTGNKIFQILESEERVFVPMGESTIMQFYFTPKTEGKYVISGRVFYDGKRTFEKSAIVNVRPMGFRVSSVSRPIFYGLLFFAILFLLYKIRKEKNYYARKLREARI
jgi:hypothetical protein